MSLDSVACRMLGRPTSSRGMSAADLLLKCPSGTFPIADVCVETTPRQPASYGSAVLECASTGVPAGPGRRLPTHGELRAALSGSSARARRGADVRGLPDLDGWRARRLVRHRPGRKRRDHAQHRRRREGLPLRRRPKQLRTADRCETTPTRKGRDVVSERPPAAERGPLANCASILAVRFAAATGSLARWPGTSSCRDESRRRSPPGSGVLNESAHLSLSRRNLTK